MREEKEGRSGDSVDGHRNASKRELVLAFIEHGSRPTAYVLISVLAFIWLLPLKDSMTELLSRTKEFQLGEWIHLKAEGIGVSSELRRLASLSPDQIQLFLIVGTKRPGYQITYNGPESTEENYRKLEQSGLLENIVITNSAKADARNLSWNVTGQGERLHGMLMGQLVAAIESSK